MHQVEQSSHVLSSAGARIVVIDCSYSLPTKLVSCSISPTGMWVENVSLSSIGRGRL